MDTTTVSARTHARPDDFEYVLATRQRVIAAGHGDVVRQLARNVPKRLSARQRDIIARTLQQYGRR